MNVKMTNYFAALLLGAKAWFIISSLKARMSFEYHHKGLPAPKKSRPHLLIEACSLLCGMLIAYLDFMLVGAITLGH
jgi:hypothetical protein